MKLMVIGANGNLGSRVTKQALDRGHEVQAVLYNGETPDERAQVLRKSLFDLNREDIGDAEAVISAFGGGFQADPSINRDAFLKYAKLTDGTDRHLIAIGGAGCLFSDHTHKSYEYEAPGHPDFLTEISRNIGLGVEELKKTENMNWTVVCPSRTFDPEGPFTGEYLIGTEEEIICNEEGKSYVTYDDLAKAMLDIAENNSYNRMKITVATKKTEV